VAITVPSQELPGVQSRGIGAPQVRSVGPDQSGQQLFNTAAQVSGALVEQETARADNAAVMAAEAKLSQTKLDLMFNQQSGVYNLKGEAALDVTNQTLPNFDKQAELIGQGLTNPRQKDQFARIVNNQRGSLNQELNRYEFTQRNEYYDNVDQANIATSLDGAVKYSNDPAQVAYYQSKGNFVIGQMGLRKGMPPEAILLEQQKFNSQVATDVIQRMATRDPVQAQQYYAANYQNMTAAAQEQVRKVLQVSVTNQMAGNMAANIFAGKGNAGAPGLVSLVMQAESGGNQSAVSPKGAIGAMQLMPETAKETSEELGIPFDLQRLATDQQYNMALGTAYLNKMVGRYDGNQAMAVAAYNAGPGAVDRWAKEIGDPRKGEITDADFIARIPYKETREYASKIVGQLQVPETATAGAKVPGSFEDRYAQGLAAATQIQNPALKKAFLDQLDDYKKANTAQVNATFDSAADYVMDGGIASVPPQILTSLPADERLKLQKMDDYRRKGTEPTTDYKKFEQFLTMPADQLASLSLAKDLQPYLSKSDLNTVRDVWEKAKTGNQTPQQIEAGKLKVTNNAMAMAGIVPGQTSKDALKPNNLEKQQQFRNALQERIDSFKLANKREPGVQETEDLANQLLLKVKLTKGGIFGGDSSQALWETKPEDLANTYVDKGAVKLSEIPPTDRREIINVLRANGQQASEANIIAAYVNRISGLGLKVK